MEHGGIFPALAHLLFWGLVILLIVLLLRHNHHFGWHQGHQDPIESAKLRYAKGEISKAEFEEIKKDLKD